MNYVWTIFSMTTIKGFYYGLKGHVCALFNAENQAINNYKLAISNGNINMAYDIGKLYEQKKKYTKMVVFYNHAINNSDERASIALGLYYASINDYNNMTKAFMRGVNINSPQAMYEMALISKDSGDINEMIRYHQDAAALGYTESMNCLGIYYYSIKRYKLAIKYYLDASSQGNVRAMHNLAILYKNINDEKNMLKYYKLSSKWCEESAIALGNYYKNERYYKQALAINPNNIMALRALGKLYLTDCLCAKQYLVRGSNLIDPTSILLLGAVYKSLGKHDMMLNCYNKVYEADMENPVANCFLGKYYHELGDIENMIKYYIKTCVNGVAIIANNDNFDEELELSNCIKYAAETLIKHYSYLDDTENHVKFHTIKSDLGDEGSTRFLVNHYWAEKSSLTLYFLKRSISMHHDIESIACCGIYFINKKNYYVGEKYLLCARQYGSVRATHELGKLYITLKENDLAIHYLEESSQEGYVLSQLHLAKLYETEKKYDLMEKYCKLAIENRFYTVKERNDYLYDAYYMLGKYYYETNKYLSIPYLTVVSNQLVNIIKDKIITDQEVYSLKNFENQYDAVSLLFSIYLQKKDHTSAQIYLRVLYNIICNNKFVDSNFSLELATPPDVDLDKEYIYMLINIYVIQNSSENISKVIINKYINKNPSYKVFEVARKYLDAPNLHKYNIMSLMNSTSSKVECDICMTDDIKYTLFCHKDHVFCDSCILSLTKCPLCQKIIW